MARGHVEVGPAFLHVGRARVVEAVPLVALRRIRSRFERLDQVALRFARAACKQDVADAHGLELDAQVLLDGAERRRVVVGGDRNPGLDQRFVELRVRRRLAGRVAEALAVGKTGGRHAGVAVERRLRAAVADARVRVANGTRHPVREHADLRVVVPGHLHVDAVARAADRLPGLDDLLGHEVRPSFSLGVPHVAVDLVDHVPLIERSRHVAGRVGVLVGTFRRTDRTLREHDRHTGRAIDVAFERRYPVAADQVVAVE